jgi:hypothetical protein
MVEERRVASVPSRGARLCLLIAALFVVACGYALLAPVRVPTSSGRLFDCGNAVNGPETTLGTSICGTANDSAAFRAGGLGVAALVVGVGGFLVFGLERREQVRTRALTEPRSHGDVRPPPASDV